MQKLILTPALFARIAGLLGRAAGLQFDASKLNTLQAHVRDRARILHCASLEEYYILLTSPVQGAEELRKLIETVTIHETSFFRNHEHYRALREQVLPALARRNAAARRLRIWSAGCATGEEPYSLAITCLEQRELAGWQIAIEATDLSERVLAIARRGTYRADALRYLEPERVARWFRQPPPDPAQPPKSRGTQPLDPLAPRREVCAISDQVRQLVSFTQLNLAAPPYPARFADFDLIFCENVIIYFRPEATRATIEQFYNRVRPGGFLFLGYSETLWQISDRFQLITDPHTFFYQRPDPAPPPPAAAPAPRSVPPAELQVLLGKLNQAPPRAEPRPGAVPAPRPAPPDTGPALAEAAELIRQGQDHVEAGRYPEAQASFAAALARNPSAVDALVGLAQVHANQGRLADARAECAKALDIDALCEDAHLLSALIARQQGQTAAAVDHLEKVIYINFESIAGHYHLAELYRTEQRAAQAAREYRRALWALARHPSTGTVNGIPATMLRQVCEQQLRRLRD